MILESVVGDTNSYDDVEDMCEGESLDAIAMEPQPFLPIISSPRAE